MKLNFKTFRMPKTHTWYIWMQVIRKDRKTGDPINVTYSISTPDKSYRSCCTLIPTLEYEHRESLVQGNGPSFELRLTWLKWTMRMLSRDVWWGDDEDETADPQYA